MSYPSERDIRSAMDRDTFSRALRASVDAWEKTGENLVEEHRQRAAEALFRAGLTLIPSQHLRDDQFVVSVGVYEAAKKIVEGK